MSDILTMTLMVPELIVGVIANIGHMLWALGPSVNPDFL